jgi:hypothetical protein
VHRIGTRERLQLCVCGEEAANTTRPAATQGQGRGITEVHLLGTELASKREQRTPASRTRPHPTKTDPTEAMEFLSVATQMRVSSVRLCEGVYKTRQDRQSPRLTSLRRARLVPASCPQIAYISRPGRVIARCCSPPRGRGGQWLARGCAKSKNIKHRALFARYIISKTQATLSYHSLLSCPAPLLRPGQLGTHSRASSSKRGLYCTLSQANPNSHLADHLANNSMIDPACWTKGAPPGKGA